MGLVLLGVAWPVMGAVRMVELQGEPGAIGAQYAKELGNEIRLLQEQYLKKWFVDPQMRRQALGAAFLFRAQMLPEHKAELLALSEGTGVDAGDLMLGNCFLDLMPMTACSTITLAASAAPDGVARFGRNLDFPAMDVADKHSVLLIVRPKGRYAFAAVSWPGLLGVLSGMNEHGLALANMEVTRKGGSPQAMPYTLLYRTVLEQCRTVEEAVTLLRATPRQTANNLMLMDAAGSRAVVEITPQQVVVRRGEGTGPLISTNHQRGEGGEAAGRCRRYDALRSAAVAQAGRIDVAALQRMLDGVNQGALTLQSMIFEPANRVIHLAVGSEATKKPYERIELGGYFRR